MTPLGAVIFGSLLAGLCTLFPFPAIADITGKARTIDGDTIEIAGDFEGRPRYLDDGDTFVIHLRSQGIDAPEKKQLCERADASCYPCGKRATEALRELVIDPNDPKGRLKQLRFKVWTMDIYGRPVVTAYDGETDVHLELIRRGWAIAYRKYLPEALAVDYLAAEAEARKAGRGLWQGRFIAPSDWRRGERLACETK